ncbi:hypothetical protein D9M70_390410 [compost metagenome]
MAADADGGQVAFVAPATDLVLVVAHVDPGGELAPRHERGAVDEKLGFEGVYFHVHAHSCTIQAD